MARINIPVKLIKGTEKAYLVELLDGRRDWVAKRNATIEISEKGHTMSIEKWSYDLKFNENVEKYTKESVINSTSVKSGKDITKEEVLSIKSTIELLYTKLQILENKLK